MPKNNHSANEEHQHMNANLYEVLDVAESATAKEISKAYKTLARKLHPDVNPDNAEAEERFKHVTAAYDVLGDEAKRAEYDQFRSMVGSGFPGGDSTRRSSGSGAGRSGPNGFGPGAPTQAASMEDLLAQMFGANNPFGDGYGGDAEPFHSGPVSRMTTTVTLDFVEALRGVDITVHTPAGPVPISVPAGINEGAHMLVRTDNGDLLVQFDIRSHDQFGRDGADLTLDVPIAFTEAALGAKITVPTFDGKNVTLKVPAGTPTGRTFRVAGRGVKHADGRTGDLLVRVQIAVPTELSDDQKAALESLASLTDLIDHPNRLR